MDNVVIQVTAIDVMNAATFNPTGFRNLHNTTRFKVLWDLHWRIQRNGQTADGSGFFGNGQQSTQLHTFYKSFNPPIRVKCIDGNALTVLQNLLH